MKLNDRVLEGLAKMVVGDNQLFPYRSGSQITDFFRRCGFSFAHDGTTRRIWVETRLGELNLGPSQSPDLPSDDLLRVFSDLLDQSDFKEKELAIGPALEALNTLLQRASLAAYVDATGQCHLRNTGSGASSSSLAHQPRPLSQEEIAQRQKLSTFLESATEDELTERMLVPLFLRMRFHRVSLAGHKEKILEFGKDLWMKFQLPTGHWIYFCAQIKRGKIDSSGAGKDSNVATILNQARMAIDHPIFDPETNRKVLLDHIFIISAGEITKAARSWLGERLDSEQRRHIIFMDRSEFLDHAARILPDLGLDEPPTATLPDFDLPF